MARVNRLEPRHFAMPRLAERLVTAAVLVVGALAPVAVWGQDASVRSFLDRNRVGVNQAFVLSVAVSGTQQLDGDPVLPDMDAFAIYLGSGQSTQMQIINGRTSVSLTIQYRFQATTEGTFDIGPVGGRSYATEPLQIVVSATAPTPPPSRGAPGADAPGAEVAPEDVFVTATANRTQVYQNEPVIIEYRLFTRVEIGSYSVTQQPTATGFWTEEYPVGQRLQVETVVRNGIQYASAVIRKVALFPSSAGTKTVGPMTIEAQARLRQRSRSLLDDFFRGGSLFGRNVPVLLTSDSIRVEVLPLPESGRSDDFSGFVGDAEISASLDKTDAETNEALTLVVRVEGEGNVRTLAEPEIDFPPDFEVYDPDVSEEVHKGDARVTGTKEYEYVLIPRAPGTKTIPPIRLSYFDVQGGSYETVSTEPLSVHVTGEPVTGPAAAGRRGGIQPLREDIRFISIRQPSFHHVDRSPTERVEFWLVVLVPLAVVGGAVGVRRHRDRLQGDVAYARHRRASRLAKQRLGRARSLLNVETQKPFYAEAGRALQGFLGDKLNIAEAGMIRDEVRSALRERQVAGDVVEEYFACLDVCDRQRFAPSEASHDEMKGFLKRAERAMANLDRGLSS
jgi:hypothetical protein